MKLITEWQEHESCLIAWPCNNDLYGEIIYEAKREVANIIIEIAKTEKVIVLCNEEDLKEVKKKIQSKNVTILTCKFCLLYTSPSPRDPIGSRMPSSA